MSLTTLQQNKLEKIKKLLDSGNVGIITYLMSLEDRLEEEIPQMKNIVERMKGDDGEDYVITDSDKKEIASQCYEMMDNEAIAQKVLSLIDIPLEEIALKASKLIDVPKAEKIDYKKIKKEVLAEIVLPEPKDGKDADEEIIMQEVVSTMEKNLPQFGEAFRDGLELLQGDNRLSITAIKGIEDYKEISKLARDSQFLNRGGNGKGLLSQQNDVNIVDPTNAQVLKYNSTSGKWENGTGGGSSTWGSITGTITNQTDLINYIDSAINTDSGWTKSGTNVTLSTGTDKVGMGMTPGGNDGKFRVGGNVSSATRTTLGAFFTMDNTGAATDTTSTGTVSIAAGMSLFGTTFAASNATTYTNATTLYIAGIPTASTNVTITSAWSLFVNSGNARFGGGVQLASWLQFGTSNQTIFDSNANEYLKFSTTASAVNELTIANAATANAPQISATGGDTNIDIALIPKGSGGLMIGATSTATQKLDVYGGIALGTSLKTSMFSGALPNFGGSYTGFGVTSVSGTNLEVSINGVVGFFGSEAFFAMGDRTLGGGYGVGNSGGFYKNNGVFNFWNNPLAQNTVSVADNGDVFIGNNAYGTYNSTSTTSNIPCGFYVNKTVSAFNGNVGIGTLSFGSSSANVLGLVNATVPTSNPVGGGVVYVEGGALKYRGSSGTITTIAVA